MTSAWKSLRNVRNLRKKFFCGRILKTLPQEFYSFIIFFFENFSIKKFFFENFSAFSAKGNFSSAMRKPNFQTFSSTGNDLTKNILFYSSGLLLLNLLFLFNSGLYLKGRYRVYHCAVQWRQRTRCTRRGRCNSDTSYSHNVNKLTVLGNCHKSL